MTTATVQSVTEVTDHPTKPTNSVLRLSNGATAISAKLDDGSPRYQPGDLVVFIADGAIVPEALLRDGFWDHEKNQGCLRGPRGDRVKAGNFAGVRSDGIMFPVARFGSGFTVGQDVTEVMQGFAQQ